MNRLPKQNPSPAVPEDKTRYLYWWLILVVVFEYARPGAWVPGIEAVRLNTLIPMALLITTFFAAGLRSRKEILADPLTKWLLVYVFLISISVFHATVTTYAVNRVTQVLGYVILF